jgi:predicted transposase/invertase (TIGR01784 family)
MTLAEQWKQEGLQQGRLEIASSMLQKGLDTQMIIEVTGLTKQQVSELIH